MTKPKSSAKQWLWFLGFLVVVIVGLSYWIWLNQPSEQERSDMVAARASPTFAVEGVEER
jgi:hypothetical protein